jgi:hypothetical protein
MEGITDHPEIATNRWNSQRGDIDPYSRALQQGLVPVSSLPLLALADVFSETLHLHLISLLSIYYRIVYFAT